MQQLKGLELTANLLMCNVSETWHGSTRQNIRFDGKLSWVENRADVTRADNASDFIFVCFFYIDNKEIVKISYDRTVNVVHIYGRQGILKPLRIYVVSDIF